MRIKKVKITNENKVHITYEELNKAMDWDEFSLTCAEKASPSFYKAMEALIPHVVTICELPREYSTRITVQGVSVSYGGELEVMGATIIAAMSLVNSNCNLNLNTPYKASESYSEGPADPKQLLSAECVKDLETLYGECGKYVRGLRAQIDMFKDPAAAKENEKDERNKGTRKTPSQNSERDTAPSSRQVKSRQIEILRGASKRLRAGAGTTRRKSRKA